MKFLQSSASIQNHEFLLVHHLQRANYIPALKLNQTLKINLMVQLNLFHYGGQERRENRCLCYMGAYSLVATGLCIILSIESLLPSVAELGNRVLLLNLILL